MLVLFGFDFIKLHIAESAVQNKDVPRE